MDDIRRCSLVDAWLSSCADLVLVCNQQGHLLGISESLKVLLEQIEIKAQLGIAVGDLFSNLGKDLWEEYCQHGKGQSFIASTEAGQNCISWQVFPVPSEQKVLFIGSLESSAFPKVAGHVLQGIVECTPGSIYWKDRNGVYLGCNQYMADVIGLPSPEAIVGKTDPELHGLDETELLRQHDQEVIKTGKAITIEEPVELADGTFRAFMAVKMPLRDAQGNIIGIVGNSVDITRLKMLEEDLREAKERAEEANRVKSDFIASMSHDLRTPLNAMIGATEILMQRDHYTEQEPFMDAIYRSGQALLSLVEDILNFMKIEAGKCEIELESCDFRQIVYDVANMMFPQCSQKGIKLTVDYADNAPSEVVTSISAIRRILGNLLGNAVKFTEQGEISISVSYEPIDSRQQRVKIIVFDTGFGIPKEKQAYIFERFARLDPVYRGRFEGLGLGLSIVKNMVDRLNGTVDVKSEVGKGSTFTVTFAVGLPEENVQEVLLSLSMSHLKVLWLSDDQVVASQIINDIPIDATFIVDDLNHITTDQLRESPAQIVMVDLKDIDSACALANRINVPEKMFVLLCHAGDQLNIDMVKQYGFFSLFRRPLSSAEFAVRLKKAWDVWLLKSRQKHIRESHIVNVLLVENDPASQEISVAMLEAFGCNVQAASSGQEALSLYDAGHYDMVFVDIGLGDMSGFDIAKQLRQQEKDMNYPVPIIALTAHVFENYERQSIEAGMNDYLTKPVLQKDFEKILQKYIFHGASSDVDINFT